MNNTTKRQAILIVDDDSSILKALRRVLIDEDYDVFTATSYTETMELLGKHVFAVVIADYKMPGICGDELLGVVKSTSPITRRVMLTGEAASLPVPASIADSILHCQHFLSKPWNDDQLRALIRECVAGYEAGAKVHPGA